MKIKMFSLLLRLFGLHASFELRKHQTASSRTTAGCLVAKTSDPRLAGKFLKEIQDGKRKINAGTEVTILAIIELGRGAGKAGAVPARAQVEVEPGHPFPDQREG